MDSTELDKLIHQFEFENQQLVKMIEKKNQEIISLSSQTEQKFQERERLEAEISQFDDDTKRLHRSYTNNRDNIACLKNTMSVMADHKEALSKQLSALQAKTSEESKSFSEHLSNYTKTRDEYMTKYQAFPLAVELEEAQKAVAVLQEKRKGIENGKADIKLRISALKDELDTKVMARIVVKIAESKLKTLQLEREIHECVTEKSVLLEQLKELQKSKQQDQGEECVSLQTHTMNVPEKAGMEVASCDSDQAGMCSETNQLANLCLEDASVGQTTMTESGNAHFQESTRYSAADINRVESNFFSSIDVDGDVAMPESSPAPDPLNPAQSAATSAQLSLQSQASARNGFGQVQQQIDPQAQNFERKTTQSRPNQTVSSAKSSEAVSEHLQAKASSNSLNLPQPQISYPQRVLALGKPRLLSRIPVIPSLPKIPPALHIPTLTVPRPLRVQQPNKPSLVQRKSATTLTTVPQIKLRSPPPPPKPLAGPASTNLLACREQPRLPTFSPATCLPLTRASTSTTLSSSLPLRQKQQQQQTQKGEAANAPKPESSIRAATVTSHVRPIPETYSMPLNDVPADLVKMDDEQNKASVYQVHTRSPEVVNKIQREQHLETSQNETTPITSTPVEAEDPSEFNIIANEPLFKLNHTFGSQSSLGSSIPHSQPKLANDTEQQQALGTPSSAPSNEHKIQPRVGPMSGLLAQLEATAGQNPCSPDSAGDGETERASVFNLFNFTQKSGDTSGREDSAVGDGEGNGDTPVFNFGIFGSNETTGVSGGWMGWGPAGDSSESQGAVNSGFFGLQFGSSKNQDDEGESQSSFKLGFGGSGGDFGGGGDDNNNGSIFKLF